MSTRVIAALALACLLLALVAFHSAVASVNPADDWPMFHHDSTHSGQSNSLISTGLPFSTTVGEAWNFTTGGEV